MAKKSTIITAFVLGALLTLLPAGPAAAIFIQPPSVPAERLIKNISAYIKDNPKDAEARFLLARVHYIAFVHRSTSVQANEEGSAKKLPNITDPRMQHPDGKGKIENKMAIEYARAAITAFRQAIHLDKDKALYHLGLAGIFEQSAPLAERIGPPSTLKPDTEFEKDEKKPDYEPMYAKQALNANLTAYKLDRDAALKQDSVFLPFYPVAYEAGKAVQRLVKQYDLEIEDDKVLDQIAADLQAIDDKPKAITPIVLRIEGESPRRLGDLIAENKTVAFDLDADGVAEQRPWVRPDTAILVWDPGHTGKITTGEQLFGNMTFRMLFSDGYRALDSLDDNRDGKLAGAELKGLALWHDRNSNGVSDAGEVSPINKTNIRAIATGSTGKADGLHPMHTSGITLDDGTTRPTWDWVIPAVEAKR